MVYTALRWMVFSLWYLAPGEPCLLAKNEVSHRTLQMSLKDQVWSLVAITDFRIFIKFIQRMLSIIFCNPSNSASFPLINAVLTFCCLFCLYTHVDPTKVHGRNTGLILYWFQLCLLRVSWCLLLKIAAGVGPSWMLISMHPLMIEIFFTPLPKWSQDAIIAGMAIYVYQ